MCYAGNCNPECGACKPKKIVSVTCPACGTQNRLQREQFLHYFNLPHKMDIMEKKMIERGMDYSVDCISCGEDLSTTYKDAMSPKPCKRMGIICGYPCGRCNDEPTETNRHCNTMVPLGKIQQD